MTKRASKGQEKPTTAKSLVVWQTIRNLGGYWTATELAAEFGLPRIAGTNEIARELTALRKSGHVLEMRGEHRRNHAYGVTAKCAPPAGETLEPTRTTPNYPK